ncbi:D-ribose ABC transporter substrate-binding protein [Domibacillus sp. A3M-37]|uniref:D-ribose ABC transporter substrate-binding protein n=1 Tax=Domibacillus sp. A3M-37 TaxID=2962037 RepID=UPI0020B66917|nr:D-ribose ABC transporter substrate-binding protein [Domibacillus sp. A3M-37]MCP3763711.1 D-ribose ABC transporter substrate-binding protein [Domibacillus sp. A3M-37]
MKKLLVVFLSIFAVIVSGCSLNAPGGESSSGSQGSQDSEGIKIGLSMSTLNNPWFVTLKDSVVDTAEKNSGTVEVVDAQNDSAKQTNDIEDLLQKEIDVLLINPTDSAAISPAVQSANSAGIPVITIDRSVDEGDVEALIVSDNVKGGEEAAKYLVETLGEGAKIAELEGIAGASATRDRGEGFHSIADSQLEVVAKQAADFDRTKALTVTENILQANPDIQGIFAQNDEMALGALQAVQASGKDIVIIGFDGSEDAFKAIEAGDLQATIAQQPVEMGQIAVESAIDGIDGKTIEKEVIIPTKLTTKE